MPDFSDRYSPHWNRVFTDLLRLPATLLNSQWHDCPCCATPAAFKATPGKAVLHAICNACGGPDQTGGIITPRELVERILSVDSFTAQQRIDGFLGFEPDRQASLLLQLKHLPADWSLVAVDGNKRPYQPAWQKSPLTKAQAAAEIKAGRAKAIGVIAGPLSNGLLFVDHDGISATAELERLGIPQRSLPPTAASTSGRDGRFQLLFRIPEHYWPQMRNRRVFATGQTDADGKAENLDFRWAGHQSVVIGAHPITGAYRWLKDRSPAEVEIAEAPHALIRLLIEEEPSPITLFSHPPAPIPQPPSTGQAIPLLDFITRTSRQLIESGGTPGSWNDDQLKLALDLVGTETWILSQGHRTDITAADAFDQHVRNAQSKARDFDVKKARQRFAGALNRNPTPGTPLDKLLSRLAFHTRTPRPSTRLNPPSSAPAAADHREHDPLPCHGKPIKLEVPELLEVLRSQAKDGGIRFNVFTQQIEINGQVFPGAERFYLLLAEQGIKASKDLAIDCLLQVAHEHPYDPVTLYLDHVAATVEPAYIDALATAYLRTTDDGPTLYDEMLKRTLIGAVRRAFEPGCKHDTACVLMGDQGGRKSSFWAVLGGPFYSDALGDCSSKDDLMILHRSWIMEWAELDHVTSRKHAGSIKAFLTQATDIFRVPYGRSTESFPRRGIIVGSTNRQTGFLQDETGNRRFWIIPTPANETNPIDTPNLAAERDAIWSAAVHAYRAGEPSYLPAHLASKVEQENLAYQAEHPWKAVVEAWLATPAALAEVITSEKLLTAAVQKPVERQTRADQMQVANLMRELGFVKRRVTVGSAQRWAFVRP
jgi:hypothetical protein